MSMASIGKPGMGGRLNCELYEATYSLGLLTVNGFWTVPPVEFSQPVNL